VLDDNDKESLKLVAWKEARGDGLGACNLVMHVVLNRVGKPGFASNIHDVIYGKNQFSSMSRPSDPEFNLDPTKNQLDPVWPGLQYVVDNIEGDDDATKGALYYQNPKTADSGWFARNIGGPDGKGLPNHPLLLTYMHHSFYA
jgi:spore germination cell wall hydrolase CwlJ-like protein